MDWREPSHEAHYLMHKAATSRVDWSALREDFPILREQVNGHPLIYFDSAASSQKPTAVLDVVRNYYEHENANVHRGLHALSMRATEHYEKSRQRVADFIGAATMDEIVFTRGTTESINLVAQAWGGKFLRRGDAILLTEMEHHSNLVSWQLLAERIGAQIRFVPVRDDGTLALEKLSSLLTPEVKMFAFTHVSNSLGTINPVADLCQKARKVGALTLVDAAQSILEGQRRLAAQRGSEPVHEPLGRQVERIALAGLVDLQRHRLQQMGLSQADAGVDVERVEHHRIGAARRRHLF